ncbi:MAG TPA: hypothetical protein VD905_00560, partial [Flavobacteriales bacterium]|nr:hypothetical protein [Flavobacteriales bacterium]
YAGVLTAAVLAVAQLYVYHSNVARPYAPGLLFTLLFLHYFLKLVVDDDKKPKTKILYITFAFCAAATHYFAGLTVGVLGLCGVILLRRHQIIPFFITNAVVVVSFIPLYLIMKNQMGHGGLGGWLGAPEKGWAFKFIHYVFHYDWIFLGFFLVAFLVSFLQLFRKRELTRITLHIVLICSFIIVYATAILYSKYKTPIAQFSILQFGLPFLLLSIFSIFHALPKQPLQWFTPLFLLFGLYSLFVTRLNHEMMMDYPYKAFAEFCEPIKKQYANEKILVVTADRPEFVSRYLKGNKNFRMVSVYNVERPYDTLLAEINAFEPLKIITGNCNFNTFGLLRSYFPYYIQKKQGFLNEFFLFTNKKSAAGVGQVPEAAEYRMVKNETVLFDSTNQFCTIADTNFKRLPLSGSCQFKFECEIRTAETNPLILVMEFGKNGDRLFWYGADVFVRPSANGFNTSYCTFDMSQELRKHNLETMRIKFYLWNAKLVRSEVRHMTLSFHQPNHKLYGLTENFKH